MGKLERSRRHMRVLEKDISCLVALALTRYLGLVKTIGVKKEATSCTVDCSDKPHFSMQVLLSLLGAPQLDLPPLIAPLFSKCP